MPGGGKGGGSTSSTVSVNYGPVTVDSDSEVRVVGLDNIKIGGGDKPLKTETKLEGGNPIKTELSQEFKITQPIVTDGKNDLNIDIKPLTLDLKPVALDLCTTISFGSLPRGIVRQPYHHHVGLTFLGVEYFGMTFCGESKAVFEDLPHRPAVSLPSQQQGTSDKGRPRGGPEGLKIKIT